MRKGVLRLGTEPPEDPVHGVLAAMRGTAYAEAKAVEIRRAETLRDRLQTVVPGIAPALLEFHPARRDIQLVVHDKDILGQKTVPRRERLYAFAGKVHEGLRLGDKPLVRLPGRAAFHSSQRNLSPDMEETFFASRNSSSTNKNPML